MGMEIICLSEDVKLDRIPDMAAIYGHHRRIYRARGRRPEQEDEVGSTEKEETSDPLFCSSSVLIKAFGGSIVLVPSFDSEDALTIANAAEPFEVKPYHSVLAIPVIGKGEENQRNGKERKLADGVIVLLRDNGGVKSPRREHYRRLHEKKMELEGNEGTEGPNSKCNGSEEQKEKKLREERERGNEEKHLLNPFTERDIELACLLANHTHRAFRSVSAFEEQRLSSEVTQRIHRIRETAHELLLECPPISQGGTSSLSTLSSNHAQSDVIERLTRDIGSLIGAHWGSVYLFDDYDQCLWTKYNQVGETEELF